MNKLNFAERNIICGGNNKDCICYTAVFSIPYFFITEESLIRDANTCKTACCGYEVALRWKFFVLGTLKGEGKCP